MEMDHTQFKLKEKLEFLDILKHALNILYKNTRFIVFSLLTSLPLLCFLPLFEIILQKVLLETLEFLPESSARNYHKSVVYVFPHNSSYLYEPEHHTVDRHFPISLIVHCVLYLVPYHLLELLSVILTVDTTLMIYTEEKRVSLRDIYKSLKKTRVKGPFITSVCVLFFSTCFLIGFAAIVTLFCVLLKWNLDFLKWNRDCDPIWWITSIFQGVGLMASLIKYLDWRACWNMALVISVVEETYGAEALRLSAYYSRGSGQRGIFLSLVFFVWELFFRVSCLLGRCHERQGVCMWSLVSSSLICVGNVIKWVVFVVYFFDCKKRVLEKKIDEEVGGETKFVES
ncbi:hypothetical protein SLA2020_237820 [Shorea laevis]